MSGQKLLSNRIINFTLALVLSLTLLMGAFLPKVQAADPTFSEFAIPTAFARAQNITAGPDGNLWFTETNSDKIGKITPSGVVTEYSTGITPGAVPYGITAGPDGNLWFTEATGNRIGKITTSGVVTEYSTGITAGAAPYGITAGPDGNLWFTEYGGDRIGKITTSGVVTEYSAGITAGAEPYRITAGPDGNLWFTETNSDRIGKITTSGVVTEYSTTPTPGASPNGITAGPDGNLWFTKTSVGQIGKITPSGVVTEYSTGITVGAGPTGITTGPDGNLWFTEYDDDKIGKITPSGVVTEYSTEITVGAGPTGITTGPDGNLWFTEYGANKIGRVDLFPTTNNPDGTKTTTISSEYDFSGFNYTIVDKQTLIVNGKLGNVTVQSGGILKGTGTVGTVTVQAGGKVAPGLSPGCLNTGAISFVSGSSLDVEIAGNTVCTQYDQLRVTGTVNLGGATLNTSFLNGFVPTVGAAYTILENDAADATGTFAGLAEGATFNVSGVVFKISYVGGSGNDVVLTAQSVPAAPNTGFKLIFANPLLILAITTISAISLFALARRYGFATTSK